MLPLLLWLAGAPVAAAANDTLPAMASASLGAALPGTHVVEWGTGPLARPGAADIAVVVARDDAEHIPDQALAVLHQRADGGYTVVATSQFWTGSDRVHWSVEIRERSIILSFDCAARCGDEATKGTYRFTNVGGALTLVAEDEVTYTNPNENDDQVGFTTDYRRGTAVYWRKIGRRHVPIRKRFTGFTPISLSQFDRWDGPDPRPDAARGTIDEHLHFTTY